MALMPLPLPVFEYMVLKYDKCTIHYQSRGVQIIRKHYL